MDLRLFSAVTLLLLDLVLALLLLSICSEYSDRDWSSLCNKVQQVVDLLAVFCCLMVRNAGPRWRLWTPKLTLNPLLLLLLSGLFRSLGSGTCRVKFPAAAYLNRIFIKFCLIRVRNLIKEKTVKQDASTNMICSISNACTAAHTFNNWDAKMDYLPSLAFEEYRNFLYKFQF